MDRRPKISVIIPVYNVENYISRCIESVIRQTLRDIEIICVNDGTEDGSIDIIKRYMLIDARIRLIEKPNGGVSSARNAGLDAADGELILFLDSDDYLALNACERVYVEYMNYHADMIIFGSTAFPEIPKPEKWIVWSLNCKEEYYPQFEPDALFKKPGGLPYVWNRAFSGDFLRKNQFRFPENISVGEDMIFLMQTMPMARGIRFIEDKLHYYQTFHQGSLMNTYDNDHDKRMRQHIENVELITEAWHKNGWLSEWGKDFFRWFLNFLVLDWVKYRGDWRDLAKAARKILQKYHLTDWRTKAGIRYYMEYRYLEWLAKQ